VVDSQRTLEAILGALPAAYRSDPRSRQAREALEHASLQTTHLPFALEHNRIVDALIIRDNTGAQVADNVLEAPAE
jgi:hypothetical protein